MANGIIIIDKPAGWTSMDVCAKLRGILKTKKVGHAGTLDPMATGVLPVFVGQATRAVSFAEDGQKEYVAGLRLGRTTDTQDTSGETLDTHPVLTGREDLEHLLPRFTGPIEQVPPMYSAVKINGQKLYELARRGHQGVGSDIAPVYSGIADGSAVTKAAYVPMDITNAAQVREVKEFRDFDPEQAAVDKQGRLLCAAAPRGRPWTRPRTPTSRPRCRPSTCRARRTSPPSAGSWTAR